MNFRVPRAVVLSVLLVLVALAAGCAKKAAETPPTPPPAPPVETKPTPTPPPTTDETPTPPTPREELSSGDFEPVFFDLDSYTLREDGRSALDKDARLLREHTHVNITVEGHCDERGTAEYNQALGEKRAQTARDYLVNAGIEGSRLQIISYGKERPFDPGHDEAAWAKNRRAHFVTR
jgi:peptidoglycan-associated lipoprotein